MKSSQTPQFWGWKLELLRGNEGFGLPLVVFVELFENYHMEFDIKPLLANRYLLSLLANPHLVSYFTLLHPEKINPQVTYKTTIQKVKSNLSLHHGATMMIILQVSTIHYEDMNILSGTWNFRCWEVSWTGVWKWICFH